MKPKADPLPFNGQALTNKALSAIRAPTKRLPRHKPGENFLLGPVPWRWIEQAGRLSGKALAVGLMLWREAGCNKSPTVRFRLAAATAFGCHQDTARRGLEALEAAGLVSVRYIPGRCLEVTLLNAPETHDGD